MEGMAFYGEYFLVCAIGLIAFISMRCARPYEGGISDHFDGTRFFHPEKDYTFRDTLKWMWTMNPAKWPKWIEDPAYPYPPENVANGKLRITHINQATILIQV